jgi:hypothetical protein
MTRVMTRVMTVVTNACDLYLVFLCHEGLILKKGGVLVKTLILGGISISTILFMLISGCGGEGPQEASQPAEQEKIKFVDVMPIQKQKEPLPPNQSATLAFHSTGTIVSLPVKKGDYVNQGEVLGKLDTNLSASDFLIHKDWRNRPTVPRVNCFKVRPRKRLVSNK